MVAEKTLFWVVAIIIAAFWMSRHVLQQLLIRKSRRKRVLFRARRNYTRAWHFYVLYVLSLLNALLRYRSLTAETLNFGFLLIFAGALISAWAMYFIRHCYSEELEIREGFFLITSGPYHFVRHPMRVGLVIEMFGLAVLAVNVFGWLFFGLYLAMVLLRNRDEDEMMRTYLARSIHERR